MENFHVIYRDLADNAMGMDSTLHQDKARGRKAGAPHIQPGRIAMLTELGPRPEAEGPRQKEGAEESSPLGSG